MRDLHLEPVGPEHAAEAQRLITSHPDIVGMTRMPDPYPEDGAATWIAQVQPQHQRGETCAFAIVRGDGQLLGMIGLMGPGSPQGTEMGYWIGAPYWNRGYATEAVRQATELAFTELDVERIFATPLERNVASCRVLEKNGYRLARRYPNTEPKWRPTDVMMEYELGREEWRAS